MAAFQKILITGISGSGGSYLAEHIAEFHPEIEIHGIARWHSTSVGINLAAIKDRVVVHECDLNDFSSVLQTLQKADVDAIFHLAAHANVRAAFHTPLSVLQNNIMGTANLFEACRLLQKKPVIQHCSTSEVYGQVPEEFVPIKEDCPINPVSPYAVSKTTQDFLALTYFKSYQLPIIRTRMFAYLNPRRTDLFATAFARQVAKIEIGMQEELVHGNLDSVRTLIDVRDAMEAYWEAITKCEPGETYNIGGETSISVGEFLEVLKSKASTKITSRVDPALLRPTDVTLQIPSTEKFSQQTGWKPKYKFEDSVEHLLNYWREQVRQEKEMAYV